MFIDEVVTTDWFAETPDMQTSWQSAVRLIAVPSQVMGTRTVLNAVRSLLPFQSPENAEKQGYRLIKDRLEYNGAGFFKTIS